MTKFVSPKGIEVSGLCVLEDNTGTYIYTGFYDSGADPTEKVCLISRETIADGTVKYKRGGFSNTWTDRATGTYE